MSLRLHLDGPQGRRWHRSGAAQATGRAYEANASYEAESLAAFLDCGPDEFTGRVARLSGNFGAVLAAPGELLLATDRIASVPLFYAAGSGGLVVSDDARWLAAQIGARLDSAAATAELMLISATVGASTLCSAVRQVRAAEIVRLRPPDVQASRYFRMSGGTPAAGDDEELVREGARKLEAGFDALVRSVTGRPIAIPMSGGLDSRLVAAMLVRGGRTDALTYTYGRPRSFETRASRRVARALGLAWEFVPYTSARWHRWSASKRFQAFRREAAGVSTIEHEQDWPAVQELLRREALQPDTVVIPGHGGGFLGGTHLSPTPTPAERDAVQWILQRQYREWPRDRLDPEITRILERRIGAEIEGFEGVDALNTFLWQERHAKMVAHSILAYDHFGLSWRHPFWADADVLDFWSGVPTRLLRGRRLYDRVLERLLGPLLDLPNTLRPVRPAIGRLRRGTDADLRRYGIWLGKMPLVRGLFVRVGHRTGIDHPVVGPVVRELAAPIEGRPLQWVPINGLLALEQLRDLAREIG